MTVGDTSDQVGGGLELGAATGRLWRDALRLVEAWSAQPSAYNFPARPIGDGKGNGIGGSVSPAPK